MSDVVEHINFEKMERIARLVHQTSWELAQTAGRMEKIKP